MLTNKENIELDGVNHFKNSQVIYDNNETESKNKVNMFIGSTDR